MRIPYEDTEQQKDRACLPILIFQLMLRENVADAQKNSRCSKRVKNQRLWPCGESVMVEIAEAAPDQYSIRTVGAEKFLSRSGYSEVVE